MAADRARVGSTRLRDTYDPVVWSSASSLESDPSLIGTRLACDKLLSRPSENRHGDFPIKSPGSLPSLDTLPIMLPLVAQLAHSRFELVNEVGALTGSQRC